MKRANKTLSPYQGYKTRPEQKERLKVSRVIKRYIYIYIYIITLYAFLSSNVKNITQQRDI